MNRQPDARMAALDDSRQDRDYLLGLSLFHYIASGFAFLSALVACVYVLTAAYLPAPGMPPGFASPAKEAVGAFIAARAVLIAGLAGLGLGMLATGRCLNRRRRYRLCVGVACAECLFPPFGTLLGVITILVLRRPSVRRLFGADCEPG